MIACRWQISPHRRSFLIEAHHSFHRLALLQTERLRIVARGSDSFQPLRDRMFILIADNITYIILRLLPRIQRQPRIRRDVSMTIVNSAADKFRKDHHS